MRTRFLFAVIWLFALEAFGAGAVSAADIYIVTNSDMKLSAGDIREIFLGDREFNGTVRLVPVDNQAVQAEFTSKVLAMAVDRYSTLWTKRAFRDAINPPVQKLTDLEVLEFVRKTHGAIGYVSSAPHDKGVVVVAKF
jgi:hypothetical protein